MRLRIDSLGLPWNIPQSMRTRARSVSSRNCEPVTVVAPPRKWICMARHGDSATARPWPPRILRRAWDMRSVERSFGELLAAFGDLVVARRRGAPADAAGEARSRRVVRRYRAPATRVRGGARRARRPGRQWRRGPARPRRTCAATLAWLDELEPTPGARPADGRQLDRRRPGRRRALRAGLYRRYGAAAGAIRFGRRDARPADGPGPARDRSRTPTSAVACSRPWRRSGGRSTAMAARRVPYRRLLRSSAARWAGHGSPIEANAMALGCRPAAFEATLHRDPRRVARRSIGPGRGSNHGTTGTRSAARHASAGSAGARERLLDLDHRYLASLGADPATLGIRYDVLPRPGRPIDPGRVHDRDGRLGGRPASTGPWTPRPPWVFATYAEGGLGNLAELLHESGHAVHYGGGPDAPGVPRVARCRDRVPRGHRRRPRLGRGRARLAAPLAGRGRRAARRRAEPLRRGHARRLLGAVRDRAPPPSRPPPERRLDRDHHRRPGHRAAPRVVVVGDPRPADRRARAISPTTPCRRSWRPRSGHGSARSAGRGSRAIRAGTGSCRSGCSRQGRRGRRRTARDFSAPAHAEPLLPTCATGRRFDGRRVTWRDVGQGASSRDAAALEPGRTDPAEAWACEDLLAPGHGDAAGPSDRDQHQRVDRRPRGTAGSGS